MDLTVIGQLLLYFSLGFAEMFMATQRTYWISKGRSRAAALLVFFENFLAAYIIYMISTGFAQNWPLLVIYAAGNSIGTFINLEKVPF